MELAIMIALALLCAFLAVRQFVLEQGLRRAAQAWLR